MKDLRQRQQERAKRRKEQMEQSSTPYSKEEIKSHTEALKNPQAVPLAESARTTSATTETAAVQDGGDAKAQAAKAGNGGGKGWKSTDDTAAK